VKPVDAKPAGVDLFIIAGGHVAPDTFSRVFQSWKTASMNRDDLVAALDVTLLAQEMHEPVARAGTARRWWGDLRSRASRDIVEKTGSSRASCLTRL
jgi:hypothetical protein